VAGNVPKAAVAQVKSPLPGVASVTNPVASDGGAEVETVPMVKGRGPQTLRHRYRAVACPDLEWLAQQAAGTRVARTRCLSNVNRDLLFEPGWVTLIVVPRGAEAKLSPSSELIREVEDYLEALAFAGLTQEAPARMNVIGPGYIQVTVIAQVVPQDIDEAEQVKQRVIESLGAFFHPLTGGPKGTGWQFGRDVYASEVGQLLEGVPGVSYVKTFKLIPNIAQHRLTAASPRLARDIAIEVDTLDSGMTTDPPPVAAIDFPEGSRVITSARDKAVLLAEPLPMGKAVERIPVKGFKEADQITKVQDLIVTSTPPQGSKIISLQAFRGDAAGFPRGSVVMTFDGTRRTRLAAGIPRNRADLNQIVVEEEDFAAQVQPGDVLTVFYPFPMRVTSVTLDEASRTQILGVEPYEAEVAFPAGSVFSTLDNRVRLPLAQATLADETTSTLISIVLSDFWSGESIVISPPDRPWDFLSLSIGNVEPVNDIVYLDDNFLVYSGSPQITMMAF